MIRSLPNHILIFDESASCARSKYSKITTSLDGQLGQVDRAFGQGLEKYRGGLNQKITSAENQAREPRQNLPNRIDTAQQRSEERSKKGFWERQWSDFVEMVSDPGFLAGLITGLLLAGVVIFLVGTGGLGFFATVGIGAAIGAISAGAGTFVSQITEGSYSNIASGNVSLSRVNLKEIGINMAVGALFGAGLAAAEVGLVAALKSTVLTVLVLPFAAGGLTVGINLLTGQPWDRNLVSNMLLTGLFYSSMRTRFARKVAEKIANANPRNQGKKPPPGQKSSGQKPLNYWAEAEAAAKPLVKPQTTKALKNFDMSNDPGATQVVSDTWKDTFINEFVQQRETGVDIKTARKVAQKKLVS